jgi:hypothetical protein
MTRDPTVSQTLIRHAFTLLCAALPAALACSRSGAPTSTDAPPSGIALPNDAAAAPNLIVLRAWEDTRVGLPPLAITRADSIDLVMAFVRSKADGWHVVDSLPGNALPAEFYHDNQLTQRFGILDMPGDSGYFVAWDGQRKLLRPASDAEWGKFLAFFGISVVTVE